MKTIKFRIDEAYVDAFAKDCDTNKELSENLVRCADDVWGIPVPDDAEYTNVGALDEVIGLVSKYGWHVGTHYSMLYVLTNLKRKAL